MEDILKVVSENKKKVAAAVFSAGVGISAATGFALLEDPLAEDMNPVAQSSDSTQDVTAELDQRREKLKTVAASTDKDTDYTRLGC